MKKLTTFLFLFLFAFALQGQKVITNQGDIELITETDFSNDAFWTDFGGMSSEGNLTFTTTSSGGNRGMAGLIVSGKKYKIHIAGTRTGGNLDVRNFAGGTTYKAISTSPFDEVFYIEPANYGIYFRIGGAGSVIFTTLSIQEWYPDGRVIRAYDTQQPLKVDESSDLAAWYEGKHSSSFILDGTSVDRWKDLSGNNRHCNNTNADATRPTWDSSTGRVTFTSANNTFLQSAAFGVALTQPNTIFIVYKLTGVLTITGVIFDNESLPTSIIQYTASTFRINAGVGLVNGATDANDNIHCAEFNGANSNYWINGVLKISGNAGNNNLTGILLGEYAGGGAHADCQIMEVIVFNADISDISRDKITGYLSNKWGITATTDFKGYIITNTTSSSWVSPTGKENDAWTDAELIYDGNLLTSGKESTNGQSVTLTIASVSCSKIRLNAGKVAGGQADLLIEVYYGGAFHQIHDGLLTEDTWQEINIGSTQNVTKARIATGDGLNTEVWEFEFESL